MAEMKSKFNDMVKSKADLQQELIKSEEQKLKVSKALIELQIENTKMNEQIQNQTFDVNTKLMRAEDDLLEVNIKEERASKAIAELQDRLAEARNDRKDMEIEFIALKKNYYNVKNDFDQEKLKNENLGVELINLVNENKALQRDVSTNERITGEHHQGKQYLEQRGQNLEKELQDTRKALLEAQGEVSRMKLAIEKNEILNQKGAVEVGNRKMELERQFLELANTKQLELEDLRGSDENAQKRFRMEKELWEGEKTDLLRKMKELNRKIEELQDDVKLVEEQNTELKSDKMKLTMEIEEVRAAHRGVLRTQAGDDEQDKASIQWRAKEELTRSFQEREQQLVQALRRKEQRADELYGKLGALKRYARQLKYLAEDLHPIGQPVPDILTQQPPVALDEEDDDAVARSQQGEISRLR